ncbi:unnamed protein product, partial [Mesorhabditis spiculigera]
MDYIWAMDDEGIEFPVWPAGTEEAEHELDLGGVAVLPEDLGLELIMPQPAPLYDYEHDPDVLPFENETIDRNNNVETDGFNFDAWFDEPHEIARLNERSEILREHLTLRINNILDELRENVLQAANEEQQRETEQEARLRVQAELRMSLNRKGDIPLPISSDGSDAENPGHLERLSNTRRQRLDYYHTAKLDLQQNVANLRPEVLQPQIDHLQRLYNFQHREMEKLRLQIVFLSARINEYGRCETDKDFKELAKFWIPHFTTQALGLEGL